MDELNVSPEEIKETIEEVEAHARVELDEKTLEPGASLERAGAYMDSEAIQVLISELTQGLTDSFSSALEAYRAKAAENAQEREALLLENREAIYTESQARLMVETTLKAYQQGYRDAMKVAQTPGGTPPPDQKLEDEKNLFPKAGEPGMPVERELETIPASSKVFREYFGEEPVFLDSHTSQPNESLSSIAMGYYGEPDLWPVIYEANRVRIGEDPGNLPPETPLDIPDVSFIPDQNLRMFGLAASIDEVEARKQNPYYPLPYDEAKMIDELSKMKEKQGEGSSERNGFGLGNIFEILIGILTGKTGEITSWSSGDDSTDLKGPIRDASNYDKHPEYYRGFGRKPRGHRGGRHPSSEPGPSVEPPSSTPEPPVSEGDLDVPHMDV